MTTPIRTRLIYLGLGSNINPEDNLPMAINCLRENLDVQAVSKVWQTPAVGSSGPDYINAVVVIKTTIPPENIKQNIISYIENELGRVRSGNKFADRTIDIDILAVDTESHDDEIWQHAHMAVPLSELNPHIQNAKTGERLDDVAQRLLNESNIKPRPEIDL